jgi:hypothetical protein
MNVALQSCISGHTELMKKVIYYLLRVTRLGEFLPFGFNLGSFLN